MKPEQARAAFLRIFAEIRPRSGRDPASETPAPPDAGSDPGGSGSCSDDGEPPTFGRVSDVFRTRLDAANMLRVPTLVADAGEIGPYWVAATSSAGSGHRHDGRTCQDSYSFCHAEGGQAVAVVVADGLGSRRHTSQVGALLLARLTASLLAAVPAEEMLADPSDALDRVLGRACSLVDEVSGAFGAPSSAPLASTLALAWVPTDPATDTVVVGRVGDCTAFGLRESSFLPVFETNLQDPLNVVSAFLPAEDAGKRKEVQLLCRADLDALVLVSDGVGEDIVGSPGVRDWLGQKWAVPCAVSRLVGSLSYRRQGSHDDRTALILWLDPARHRQAAPDDPPDQA